MCGIVGIAGHLEHKDEATTKRLITYDYFRGPDSTGFAAVRATGEVKLAKLASHPFDLFDLGKFKEALSGYQSTVFLGHNRLATKGAISSFNAHPFEFEHIVGCHNGTLDYSAVQTLEKELGEKFPVDSQALIAAIARMGLKATIEMISGAWSIVYYDGHDGTINFLRNDQRPMHYGYTKDFKKVLWASDWWMMEMAARHSQGYEMYVDKDKHSYFETEADVHYRWSLEELRSGSSKVPKPKVKKIKGKDTAVSGGTNFCPFQRQADSQSGTPPRETGSGTSSTTNSRTSSRTGKDFFHLVGRTSKPFGDFVPEQKYFHMSRGECSWCGDDLEFGKRGQVIIEPCNVVLCTQCSPDQRNSTVFTNINAYF